MCSQRESYIEARDNYLAERSWVLKRCPKCSCDYYTKREVGNCASYNCNEGYTFTTVNSPRHPVELVPFVKLMSPFFAGRGYVPTAPIGLLREDERTLFASAAGQVFDQAIYKGIEPAGTTVFAVQPVIRLQMMEQVGLVEGFATSFLNAATEQWQATATQHFVALDAWLDFFSAQGLYIGNLCLEVSQETENWDGRMVKAENLRVNYAGLEIAIANFFYGITQAEGGVNLSDISVGPERLVWAINKTSSYFDAIGPLYSALIGRVEAMDAIRTITLMASAGVMPGHKSHGYKLRSVAKSRARHLRDVSIRDLVNFYYAQWAEFIKPTQEKDVVDRVVSNEISRNINNEINDLLGSSFDCEQTTEDFLRTVVRKGKSTPDKLRDLIRK